MSAGAAISRVSSAKAQTASASSGPILLQRKCACGSGKTPLSETCEECQSRALQTKLVVGASDDPLEREADWVAAQVMRMPKPVWKQEGDKENEDEVDLLPLQTNPVERDLIPPRTKGTEREPLQTKSLVVGRPVAGGQGLREARPIVHRVLSSPGGSLDPATREFMKSPFGHDFRHVRVHANTQAAESAIVGITAVARALQRRDAGVPVPPRVRDGFAVRARADVSEVRMHASPASHAATRLFGMPAFTIGRDIYLGDRATPTVHAGRDPVLEHELVHAAQQRPWTGGPVGLAAPDGTHEREARRIADRGRALHASAVRLTPSPPVMMGQMGLHPVFGIPSLACAVGFFLYAVENYQGKKHEKWVHCWTSCKIATWCPPLTGADIVLLLGALHELVTNLGWGPDETRDMVNNVHGIGCAYRLQSCEDCCYEALAAGTLAQAEGAGETRSRALASAATGRADTGPTRDDAVALAREPAGVAGLTA